MELSDEPSARSSVLTKGYFQNKSKLYKFSERGGREGGVYAYVGRKRKKRDYRSLWIVRIIVAAREHGMSAEACS